MILARNTITVSIQRDTDSVYRFYKLQASTAAVPAKPTSIDTLPPSGWSATEPTYTDGSTNSLYFVDLTIFTDGTFTYTDVSLSSSYEAAKAAYTKAVAANNTAVATKEALDKATENIIGTQTSNTYNWTGTAEHLTELTEGTTIQYLLPRSVGGTAVSATYTTISSGATTNTTGAALNLTLADGTQTGNIPIWYQGVGRLTSHFGYGSSLRLVYHKDLVVGGTYKATGWWVDAQYNSDTVDNRIVYFTGKTGDIGIWGGSLFMRDSAGTYQNICTASDGTVTNASSGNGARTTATTKKANPNGFEIGSPIWYSSTSYNKNTNISGSNQIYASYGNVFDSRYAFNTTLSNGAAPLTAYKNIYLVGTVGSDGLFYLDTVWWTQTPNNANKVYVLVGGVYDCTTSYARMTLYEHNTWCKYVDGKLVDYSNNLAALAQSTADGKNSVFYQTSAPSTSGRKTYDVWFDTDDGNKMYYWNGSAWTARQFNTSALANSCVTADLIASNAVTADKILAGAVVAGKLAADSVATNNIQAGAITAAKIEAGTITATQIASGTITGTQIAASTIKAANIDVTDLFAQTITATGSISGAEIHAATGSTIGDTSQTHVSMSANSMDIQYGNQSPFMHVGYSGSADPTLPGSFPYYLLGTLNSSATGNGVGFYAFGAGCNVAPVGNYSVAEGYGTKAFGVGAHAEGYQTIASAWTSFPQYEDNTGRYVTPGTSTTTGHTHAEGNATEALGNDSHSQNCQTHAYGDYSHAEGYGTYAYSVASHAEGKETRVYSDYSHAGGLGTIAASEAQTVIGKYNTCTEDSTSDPSVFDSGNYAFVIGNGSSDSARSNALTVDWSGNLNVAGDVLTSSGISLSTLNSSLSNIGITQATSGNITLTATGTMQDVVSISLSAGVWVITGDAHFASNSNTGRRSVRLSYSGGYSANTTASAWYLEISTTLVCILSGTETVKLQASCDALLGVTGILRAVRIK